MKINRHVMSQHINHNDSNKKQSRRQVLVRVERNWVPYTWLVGMGKLQLLQKKFGHLFLKLNIQLLYDPATALLGSAKK